MQNLSRHFAISIFFYIFGFACIDAIDQYGEYEVAMKSISLRSVLDKSNPSAVIVYPELLLSENNTETFPLIIFAHGFQAGNFLTYYGHRALLNGLASFGFIVAAPRSCHRGCPAFFFRWYPVGRDTYPQEILKLIDYVDGRTDDPLFQFVDRDAGYGIFGHSMGGRAISQALAFADGYNIKAGIALHPGPPGFWMSEVEITVPTAVFTGTIDNCCGEETSKPLYDAIDAPAKAYANMIRATHLEPNFSSTRWTAYVAAWFKIYLKHDSDIYYDLIYGNVTDSLCGGEILMKDDCETVN